MPQTFVCKECGYIIFRLSNLISIEDFVEKARICPNCGRRLNAKIDFDTDIIIRLSSSFQHKFGYAISTTMKDRICRYCGKIIPKGTKALMGSKSGKEKYWIHILCPR